MHNCLSKAIFVVFSELDNSRYRKLTPEEQAHLRTRLTPMQYQVTQEKGTEYPFRNEYNSNKKPGEYHCVVCSEHLFS